MRLSITIDTKRHAEQLKEWLSHVDFVQHVEDMPVQWALVGSPATEEEINKMLDDCMASDEGRDVDDFFASLT